MAEGPVGESFPGSYDDVPRLYIDGGGEPRYWREVETGPRSGEWVASISSSLPSVAVTPKGVQVFGLKPGDTLRPGKARWLANRLLESAAVYEVVFGGDGSGPPGSRPTILDGGTGASVPTGKKVWVCGCGKTSVNKGAMSFHEAKCPQAPAVLTEV